MKLNGDDYCVQQLKKLNDNGITFDQLWDQKLYFAVSSIFITLNYVFS